MHKTVCESDMNNKITCEDKIICAKKKLYKPDNV